MSEILRNNDQYRLGLKKLGKLGLWRHNVWIVILSVLLCNLFAVGVCADPSTLNLTLIYSGNEQGLLWAHGCDEQIGGLDRRHTIIKSLKERESVLNLHTGNILDLFNPQSEVVYQIALEALSIMSFDAMCPGPEDFCLPIDSMKALHANHPDLPSVCANLEDQNGFLFMPYVLREIPSGSTKPIKVAVVGLISKAHETDVKYYHQDLTVTDPGFVLANLKDDLAQKSDFVVVLLHTSLDEARRLAEEFPWVGVIVVTQDEQVMESAGEGEGAVNIPVVVGETTIVIGTSAGESVGVLEMELDRDMRVMSRKNQFIQVSEQITPSEDLSTALALYDDLVENYGLDGEAAVPRDRAIHMVYFYKRGCGKCAHFSSILRDLKVAHPEIVVEKRNVEENQELLEAMGEIYNIPEAERLTTPALFIGDTYFLDELDEDRLGIVVEKYLLTGVASKLPQAEAKTGDARSRIISRFQSFGVLTVVIAGLLDGINPCAFATIVLFISYMSLVGRQRKEMLVTGIAFTSAVFVTYLLLGMGALRFLELLNSLSIVAKIIYLAAAIATFTLAILSFYDAYKAKQGKAREIKLQLPKPLKDRIHRVIRRQARTSGIVVGALVIGFSVSALELVCTGQVYLPTITFVAGVEGMKIHALSYLLLYNLMFVVPLLVVFGLVYLGTTFIQLSGFLQRHLTAVKLGTGGLLMGLSIWLFLSVV